MPPAPKRHFHTVTWPLLAATFVAAGLLTMFHGIKLLQPTLKPGKTTIYVSPSR